MVSWAKRIPDVVAGLVHAPRFYRQLLDAQAEIAQLRKDVKLLQLRQRATDYAIKQQRELDEGIVRLTQEHGVWS